MRLRIQAPAGVLLLLACLGVHAATSTAPDNQAPPVIRAAIRQLWATQPEVVAARAQLEAARAQARALGRPTYNPELELAAENADVDRRTVGVSLGLDLSGKRTARRDAGKAGVRLAEATHEQVRRDVAMRWLKASIAVSLTQREVALGSQRLELMQRFSELAQRRLKVGDISLSERDLAELALVEAKAQQAALQGKAAGSRAALDALGASSGSDPADLIAQLPGALEPTPTMSNALPELARARAAIEGAEADITIARRARVPDPVVAVTGGRVRTGPGRSDNVVGLNLSLPLPVRNTYRDQVDAARAQADAAYASLDAERLAAQAREREARGRYTALREAAQAFRASRAAAFGERAALLDRLWQGGEISSADYLIQLKQSLDTALAGVALEGETWQAFIDHLGASGTLPAWLGETDTESHP